MLTQRQIGINLHFKTLLKSMFELGTYDNLDVSNKEKYYYYYLYNKVNCYSNFAITIKHQIS